MRRSPLLVTTLIGSALTLALSSASGCGGSGGGSAFGDGGNSSGGGSSGGGSGSSSGLFGGSSSGGSSSSSGGMVVCPSGLQCGVQCSGGGTTSISGTVLDPAGKNPLYNIEVFVPEKALEPLPKGVPMGADACNCGALFKSGAVVSATTGVDGTFKITDAPVGSKVPLVIQVGKWRRQVTINVKSCVDNPQPMGSLTLPSTVGAGDTNDNMPDIAVSTGGADTLECLMKRIGLPDSEYVAGAGGTGHIHVFSGGSKNGGGGVGQPELPGMTGAPASATSLWDSAAHLNPYDILLLSCEGGETYNANPAALETYLNGGGRAFASHYHYSWFSGPNLPGGSNQSYTAPADWGPALADWTANGGGGNGQANGKIVQTLNGSTKPFAKGQALFQWLGLNKALGVLGAPTMELPMRPPRYNAVVGPSNKPSQAWVNDDSMNNTMYFSFDTPVSASPNYCGRAVFSDLHVGGETMPADKTNPPGGCSSGDLSPQEKALEFMLFDLSSCVISDTVPPSTDGGIPIFQ